MMRNVTQDDTYCPFILDDAYTVQLQAWYLHCPIRAQILGWWEPVKFKNFITVLITIVIIKICEQMKKQLESEIHSEWNNDAIQGKTENDAWFIFRTVSLQVLPCYYKKLYMLVSMSSKLILLWILRTIFSEHIKRKFPTKTGKV